jgi:hypothetical protein
MLSFFLMAEQNSIVYIERYITFFNPFINCRASELFP